MRRRDFITLLGSATTMRPLMARAQQPAMPVIGFLSTQAAWESAAYTTAFRLGLEESGYVEGRNVMVEYRWAENHYDRLPTLAADLLRRPVSIIAATGGGIAVQTAKALTTSIPIVFQIGADPVALGLVASLNRPGGNLTGITGLGNELSPKRLQLLKEVVQSATALGLLVNPKNPSSEVDIRNVQDAAQALGLQLHVVRASGEGDLTAAFAVLTQLRIGGLVIAPDGFFVSAAEQLATMTQRHAMPAIYQYRAFVAAGGLMSYGSSVTDQYRQVGIYAGRILKGEKPGELPVQQSTKVELFLNLKTAKTLSLSFPITLLGRADEVIE
jgi:putative ABC transport system substrate-binding protein